MSFKPQKVVCIYGLNIKISNGTVIYMHFLRLKIMKTDFNRKMCVYVTVELEKMLYQPYAFPKILVKRQFQNISIVFDYMD